MAVVSERDAPEQYGREAVSYGQDVAVSPPLPSVPPMRRILFGREDLTRVYDRARDYIVRHKLLRLTCYEDTDGIRRLTICNLWRIERHPDQHIELFEFDLVQTRWVPCHNTDQWPDMPFCPIRPGLGWWRDIIRLAVHKALSAAGFDDLSDIRPPLLWEIVDVDEETLRERGPYFRPAGNSPKVMGKSRMADILTRRYIGKMGLTDDNTLNYRGGILDTANLECGARALRAQFCEHILDGEVLSQVLAINFRAGTMRQYLGYALYREGLLKVGRERRNLLPLLPLIKPRYWAMDTLFAEKYWVYGASGKTALDRRFKRSVYDGGIRQLSLPDKSAWRWMSKAPLTVVRAWADNGCHKFLPALLAKTGFRGKAPVYAYAVLFSHWGSNRLQQSAWQLGLQGSRLLKIYFEHSAALWQTQGYQYTKDWLKAAGTQLNDLLDWLMAEGFEQGHPHKNATWQSLQRHSRDWHDRVALQSLTADEKVTWPSALEESCIGDIRFIPLTSNHALACEGHEMHHCISSYTPNCIAGHYRAFSVIEPDGTRATLGMAIDGKKVIFDQIRGERNGPVSDAAQKAGKALCRLYASALKEQLVRLLHKG